MFNKFQALFSTMKSLELLKHLKLFSQLVAAVTDQFTPSICSKSYIQPLNGSDTVYTHPVINYRQMAELTP